MTGTYKIVKEIKLGIYLTWGGGVVLKLITKDSSKLFSLQNENVFNLQETINRSIKDKGFINTYKPAIKSKWTNNYLNENDYRNVNESNQILRWKWHVYQNCIKVEFNLRNSNYENYQFNLEELFYLKSLVDEVINNKELVDLRKFRNKTTGEMQREIDALKGTKLHLMFQSFENSIDLHDKNFEQLKSHLKIYTGKIKSEKYAWVRRYEHTLFLNEVLRLLHNYVAACKSLIDHTRVFNKSFFECQEFHELCQNKINELFINNPLSNFIKQLREYTQHYALPSVLMEFKFNDGVLAEIYLVKKDLLVFSGWKSKAKQFLTNQNENINLLQAIKDYHANTVGFYSWIREQKNSLYWVDFREIELKRNYLFAKEGEQIINKVNQKLESFSSFPPNKLLELFDSFLSSKELYDLKEFEGDWPKWLEKAVYLSALRYPIDINLQNKLLNLKVNS